jgi:hypothetical protein
MDRNVFGSERLTGALLDRLTHHVNILEMNGDSYRLGQSRARKAERARMRPPLRLRPPGDLMRAPKVAGFYTAAWPDFAPPLTHSIRKTLLNRNRPHTAMTRLLL